MEADAADNAAIDQMLSTAADWANKIGHVPAIVVVNAGRGLVGGLTNSDESQWEYLYKLNVPAPPT